VPLPLELEIQADSQTVDQDEFMSKEDLEEVLGNMEQEEKEKEKDRGVDQQNLKAKEADEHYHGQSLSKC
jgi:hypothetical protein